MKRICKFFGFIVFMTVILSPVMAQTLNGTYTYRAHDGYTDITFTGYNWTLSSNGTEAGSGSYHISGNSVFLNNQTTAYFTIVDAATLRDTDGDLWRKEAAGTVTISGLNRHSGKYISGLVILTHDKTLIFCTERPSASSILGVQIPRNGTVTLNVYIVDHPGNSILYNTAAPYSGSDTAAVGTMRLIITGTPNYQTSTDDIVFENTQTVTFSGGNASINFSRGWRESN